MSEGPWPTPVVGAHVYLPEPSPAAGNTWDQIPTPWQSIRFDAVDVLFISPFKISDSDYTFDLDVVDGGSLLERFKWVVATARSTNLNIKIILEQWWNPDIEKPGSVTSDFRVLDDSTKIQTYADSVADFLEVWYNVRLPSSNPGEGTVSARLDGWEVDVEGGNLEQPLPTVLTAVRASLDGLRDKLNSQKFSVSVTPAWPDYLDSSVALSVDYIDMQNYDGGYNTSPKDYKDAIPGLQDSQLIWGISAESPKKNTLPDFECVKAKAQAVAKGEVSGVWVWRLNSDNLVYENMFQVWLYGVVHGVTLPNAPSEDEVSKGWLNGGRGN